MTRLIIAWSNKIQAMRQRAANTLSRTFALLWQKFYRARYHLMGWHTRHKYIILLAVIILVINLNIYFFPILRSWLEKNVTVPNRLADFRSLFLQLGSALIAAAAIAFSLVMFAMQVNVERMPHGLFRKFSTDIRLISAFLGTLLLAISIACASLIHDISWVAAAILGSFWGVILIFVLFWNAYRRALVLINPTEQLKLLINDTKSELRVWVRRAKRAAPLLQGVPSAPDVKPEPLQTTHDYPRLIYFQANPQWTAGAQRAIHYAVSFARRYAENGDHEVSGAALTAIIIINQEYVEAKGKTFFHNPPFFENPLSSDGFINNTLELLRQSMRIGIARGDEQQTEQTLKALAILVKIYMGIDYSNKHASKYHAHLAAGYLSDAVQAVVPHNMADVLMEGVRLMGQSALLFLTTKSPELITTLTDKIGLIACAGIANEKYRPVTLIAIDQLAKLTLTLIRTDLHNIHFIADNLKNNVTLVAKLFLKVPTETFFESPLKAYFSVASPDALLSWLTVLVNAVLEAESEDEAANKVIRNIETWADGLHRSQKELLIEAIEKRSRFTFDMIHWIADVAKLLMAVSNAPSCADHSRDKLRKHALWLMYTLSWIPDDKETASFVEAYQLTETLFEVAKDAYYRDCPNIYEELKKLLLGWAFKGGMHQTGWGILERSLYGLATLSLTENSAAFEDIKRQIADRLTQPNAPDQEIRVRTARDIRQRAATLYRNGHWSSIIEYAMSQVDRDKMKSALEELANILSPDTADEPVNICF